MKVDYDMSKRQNKCWDVLIILGDVLKPFLRHIKPLSKVETPTPDKKIKIPKALFSSKFSQTSIGGKTQFKARGWIFMVSYEISHGY